MNAMVLGMTMLVSSSSAAPTVEMPRVAPSAFTFNLSDVETASLREQPRRVREPTSSARVQREAPKRVNNIVRALAIGAGAGAGFMAGARIGWEVTPKRGPDDDVSGLKGLMVGAPIGAVLGAVLGWQLTK